MKYTEIHAACLNALKAMKTPKNEFPRIEKLRAVDKDYGSHDYVPFEDEFEIWSDFPSFIYKGYRSLRAPDLSHVFMYARINCQTISPYESDPDGQACVGLLTTLALAEQHPELQEVISGPVLLRLFDKLYFPMLQLPDLVADVTTQFRHRFWKSWTETHLANLKELELMREALERRIKDVPWAITTQTDEVRDVIPYLSLMYFTLLSPLLSMWKGRGSTILTSQGCNAIFNGSLRFWAEFSTTPLGGSGFFHGGTTPSQTLAAYLAQSVDIA